ncbi:MAG: hypothetical protein ACKVK6_04380, partial [bacterium]
SWMVILDRLTEADWHDYFWGGGSRPELGAYWKRLTERDSYREQVFEKRCPMTLLGIEEVKRAKQNSESLRAALEGR